MVELRPFHYAFAVADLEVAQDFYVNTLGAQEARSDEKWIDFKPNTPIQEGVDKFISWYRSFYKIK